ncbi:helix-turn-helix domain-containing protein, partial [Flavonifractor sp. An4]|uniref:helix-turn-helix domain-containing protein n=1 Tax=Flavonifractor sp. An4 TaxID=1965634 RepID=UPI0019529175
MADGVIRVQRSGGYTVLPNGILRDTGLSLKTKGLFAIILSLPEDWDYSVAGLATVAGCGRDAIRSALGEMEQAGYLIRTRSHGEGGKFTGVIYNIRDQAEPLSGKPTTVEPTLEKPSSENPTQLNKDISNKDLINPHSPPEGDGPQRKKRQRRLKSVPTWKPERFEAFWDYYPRGEDRMGAVEEWDKLQPDDALIDRMARALAR